VAINSFSPEKNLFYPKKINKNLQLMQKNFTTIHFLLTDARSKFPDNHNNVDINVLQALKPASTTS